MLFNKLRFLFFFIIWASTAGRTMNTETNNWLLAEIEVVQNELFNSIGGRFGP